MGSPKVSFPPYIALLLAIVFFGFSLGVLSQSAGLPGAFLRAVTPRSRSIQHLHPPHWNHPYVLLVVGQSNAANHGNTRARGGTGTYSFSVNGLFPLEDPLPGASGPGGSPWPHWAGLFQRSHPQRHVVVASIAQGSSAVVDWIPGGAHAQRLPAVMKALRRQGLAVSAVVWHQGETEAWNGADPSTYAADLRRWIASVRALGITAPVFVCLTSRDGFGVINPAIRQAQASVWSSRTGVFAGPDTDSLGEAFRSDGVHFNVRGLEAFATLLQRAMAQPSSEQAPRLEELPLERYK